MEHKILIIMAVFLAIAIVFFLLCLLFAMAMNRERRELVSHCNKLSYELQELRKINKI